MPPVVAIALVLAMAAALVLADVRHALPLTVGGPLAVGTFGTVATVGAAWSLVLLVPFAGALGLGLYRFAAEARRPKAAQVAPTGPSAHGLRPEPPSAPTATSATRAAKLRRLADATPFPGERAAALQALRRLEDSQRGGAR